jgi:CRISPR/Cas system-associated endonuclease Cas1
LKNVFLRKRQLALSEDTFFCLSDTCEFVALKIRNQRTLLRHNHIKPPTIARAAQTYAEASVKAEETDELLGIEGNAARILLRQFHRIAQSRE